MDQLSAIGLCGLFLIFVWSGFVRTALGFGGAVLSLPLFLLILDDPVEIIPVIGIHLLIVVLSNFRTYKHHVNWKYFVSTLPVILPFKIAGVIGLLSLPPIVLNIGVYLITLFYALSYITQRVWHFDSKIIDWVLLGSGAYISGTSLIGAPLIIAVYSKHLSPQQMRSTLFALWTLLVSIKLSAFVITDTPLQLQWALYTLPFAWIGHILGDKAHERIMTVDKSKFLRIVGIGLLSICLIGLINTGVSHS